MSPTRTRRSRPCAASPSRTAAPARSSEGGRLSLEEDGRALLVERAGELAIAALAGDGDRGGVVGVDEADGACGIKISIGPGNGGADRLARHADAMRPRGQGPADLRRAGKGRREIPLEIG